MNALARSYTVLTTACLLLTACGGGSDKGVSAAFVAPDAPPTTVSPVTAVFLCTEMQGKSLETAVVTKVSVVNRADLVPAYCEVSAHIDPSLNFQIRLPEGWNGKLHYEGGGGFDGIIPAANQNALQKGFATVSSDSGHTGAGTSALAAGVDASWALNNPNGVDLFGARAIPLVMGAATAMIQAAYGKNPSKSFFEGCSNGGREALMTAERYPQLFDGIIAKAPAYNWIGLFGAFNVNAKAVATPGAQFTAEKLTTLASAIRDKCDAADGLVDGVVSNLSACKFDPQVLRCADGADAGGSCLSDPQLALLKTWTSPAAFNGGQYWNTGWDLTGNEDEPTTFASYLLGANFNIRNSYTYLLQDNFIKYFLARSPAVDSLGYVYDQDPSALVGNATVLDVQPDLRGFSRSGGKLILWHGTSDAAISAKGTTEYFNAVNQTLGASGANATIRYFQAPGVSHCGGGAGAATTDFLAALDEWDQSGNPPETLTAAKVVNNVVAFTRPLCRFPMYPKYVGPVGDASAAKMASSFTCVMP